MDDESKRRNLCMQLYVIKKSAEDIPSETVAPNTLELIEILKKEKPQRHRHRKK